MCATQTVSQLEIPNITSKGFTRLSSTRESLLSSVSWLRLQYRQSSQSSLRYMWDCHKIGFIKQNQNNTLFLIVPMVFITSVMPLDWRFCFILRSVWLLVLPPDTRLSCICFETATWVVCFSRKCVFFIGQVQPARTSMFHSASERFLPFRAYCTQPSVQSLGCLR